MPNYNFICQNCQEQKTLNLSINDFIKLKKEILQKKCENCLIGVISIQIGQIIHTIDKSKEQIVLEVKEEVRKTVEKIESGDIKTIMDIYGEELS